jgi:hypothetical protein
MVKVPAPLRAVLDDQCIECHDREPYDPVAVRLARPFDLRADALPRPLLVRMTEMVAQRQMPKPPRGMPPEDRAALVRLFIATLWPEGSARREAERYFGGMMQPLPASMFDTTMAAIAKSAPSGGEEAGSWGALERSIWPEQAVVTPGFVATSALEAVRVCRRASDRAACLRRALDPHTLARAGER